jgi:integrase
MGLILFGAGLRCTEARTLKVEQCSLFPVPAVTVSSKKGRFKKGDPPFRTRTVAILPQYRPYFTEWLAILRGGQAADPKMVQAFSAMSITNRPGIRGIPSEVGTFRFRKGPELYRMIGPHRPAKWWRACEHDAGLPVGHRGPQKGRRTWATFLARMTFDAGNNKQAALTPWDLAHQLGHTNLQTTMKYYEAGPHQLRFPSDYSLEWTRELEEFEPHRKPVALSGRTPNHVVKRLQIVEVE